MHAQDASRRGFRGKLEPHTHVWVPGEVIQDVKRAPRVDWGRLPTMAFTEFLHGLRQRNWTCRFYNPAAVPWKVRLQASVRPWCTSLEAIAALCLAWLWLRQEAAIRALAALCSQQRLAVAMS